MTHAKLSPRDARVLIFASRFAPRVMLGLDPSICRREKAGISEPSNDVRAEGDARVEPEDDGAV